MDDRITGFHRFFPCQAHERVRSRGRTPSAFFLQGLTLLFFWISTPGLVAAATGQDPPGLAEVDRRLEELEGSYRVVEGLFTDCVRVYRALDEIGAAREGRSLFSQNLDLSPDRLRQSAARILALPDPCPGCGARGSPDQPLERPLSIAGGGRVLRSVSELKTTFQAFLEQIPVALSELREMEVDRRRLEAERTWLTQRREGGVSSPLIPAPSPPDIWPLLKEADALLLNGQNEEARERLAEVLRLYPRSPEAFLGRGLASLAMEDYQEAAVDFGSALALAPGNPLIHFFQGLVRENLGLSEDAWKDYQIACEGSIPEACEVLREIAMELEWDGTFAWDRDDVEEARRLFSQAIQVDPRYPDAWFNRALTWELEGNHSLAIQDYNAFIQQHANAEAYALARPVPLPEKDPSGMAEAHIRIGWNTLKLGSPAQAIPHFDQGIELARVAAPGEIPKYLYLRAQAHYEAGSRAAALQDLTAACSLKDEAACEMKARMGGGDIR